MATAPQPFLHELVTCFVAPTAALSGSDGQMHGTGAHGVLHADVRVLSEAVLRVSGAEPETIHAAAGRTSGTALFTAVVRAIGDPGPDPTALLERWRTVGPGLLDERLVVINGGDQDVSATLDLDLAADLASVESVKMGHPAASGRGPALARARVDTTGAGITGWRGEGLDVELLAEGADVHQVGPHVQGEPLRVRLSWTLQVPARGRTDVTWGLRAHDTASAVIAAGSSACWSTPTVTADDPRLAALLARSLADLAGLRMAAREHPGHVFCAAGSPWYFTLFGRDSLWAARMLLPLGTDLAAGTLRVLAAYQGTARNEATGEAPGKIPHELRRAASIHADMSLPSLYYGTVDATPLWVILLHDAWRWGLPVSEVRELLPAMRAALGWVLQDGDADGDGFLEYTDHSGRGLANQGWKDSGDAIRFADGSLATGPVALCEVQGYAYEAAVGGADLLAALGEPGAEDLRHWAAALKQRFRDTFWIGEGRDRRPALALDGAKRPVDSVTTNIGHLLGTGILDAHESDLVAARLARSDMHSGFGLRTMSSSDGGYWPLSYHCGSVWPHDTAIVMHGLARTGYRDLVARLADDLLSAGERFEFRLPELYAGQSTGQGPVPYPASCRPQAWSAAASVVLLQSLLGLAVDVPGGRVQVRPCADTTVGAIRVEGLVVEGRPVTVEVDRRGQVVVLDGIGQLVRA